MSRAEPDVIDFLRATVAERAHSVTKVEASARAAGLLNEGQRITHAKAFKRAKKSLGIRSLHAGFGARSQWLWELPRENEAWANAEPQAAPVLDAPVQHNRHEADISRQLAMSAPLTHIEGIVQHRTLNTTFATAFPHPKVNA